MLALSIPLMVFPLCPVMGAKFLAVLVRIMTKNAFIDDHTAEEDGKVFEWQEINLAPSTHV